MRTLFGGWTMRAWLFLLLLAASISGAEIDKPIIEATENAVILPEPIPDPLEPVNRALTTFNEGLMKGVIQPTAKVYRGIVCRPLRDGIRNFGQNLGYPNRLINNTLQGKWSGARDETYRFLANTFIGVGGFADVGEQYGIRPSPADFGQTLGKWGWKPKAYLMLPIAGPSNERDALGAIADKLMHPLTYFSPYSYVPTGILYNNLTDSVDDYVRLSKVDFDPYFVLKHAWSIRRESDGVDMTFEGPQDIPSLETLQSVFFTFQDEEFYREAKHGSVELTATAPALPYTYWMQRSAAPVVYIIPGLGSHRWSGGTLALAELLVRQGYSVVCVSSAYNYEFIERASSSAMPGHTPTDVADMHRALTSIDRALMRKYADRIRSRALVGFSMGGFHTLQIAARDGEGVQFDRYLAIHSPVNLANAMDTLDNYFRAALAWPAAERTERIERLLLKVAELSKHVDQLKPGSPIPFSAAESQFIIGLAFRLHLREMIFLSQLRHDQGLLTNPVRDWRREPVYREILQYSFREYLEKFVTPYYQERGINLADKETYQHSVDLRVHEAALKANSRVHVVENANDILLTQADVDWLQRTFAPSQLTIFERGGHLGNLDNPHVQRAILSALEGLRPTLTAR